MEHGISFWKARQSNMTSGSSDVTMTAFEPVLAACNAYKSKRVSASSCVDYSSATSIHSSAIILKQVSSRLHKMTCHAALSLYHCSFHSPTQNLTRLVLLNELHRIFSIVVCCVPLQAMVLKGCVCTLVSSFRIFDGRLAVYVKDNVNPTTLYTHLQYHEQDRLCQLCKCSVVAVHPLYQTHSINDAG